MGAGQNGNGVRVLALILATLTTLDMKTIRSRLARMSFLCNIALLLLPSRSFAHTIAEILKNPPRFDQQPIVVTGEVANVVTRYGDAPSTTFDLLDSRGSMLSILVSGVPQCKQGEVCRVQGLFVAQKHLILPEKIERVAERREQSTSVLFRERKGSGKALGGNMPRGMYIPQ